MKSDIEAMLKKAGVIVPSKGSLAGHRFASGTLIVEFAIPARPVPWKVPHVNRFGPAFKDKTLVAWQETVKQYGALAMAGMAPYSHACELRLEFWLAPIKGRTLPDTSNLTKALEDSLQGVVIENDRKVRRLVSERFVGLVDEVRVAVYAVEDM